MVKATIKLSDGTHVEVEGSPEEVAKTKELLLKETHVRKSGPSSKKRQKTGPLGLILELKAEEFFDTPKNMGEVKTKLEEIGHYYPTSSLSPALIRLVQSRELGRIKKDGSWVWVKR